MTDGKPFLKRVLLINYKSIEAASVDLQPLTFLVGPNGSGKSNFLNALGFTAESLRSSLDHALRGRGGIGEVRRRGVGHPTHFGIRLEFQLESASGHYAFRIGARPKSGYEVQTEECVIQGEGDARFLVSSGVVEKFELNGRDEKVTPPAAAKDRLYLVNVSGFSEFRPLYEALSTMGFYSLNPDRIRDLQAPDAGDLLVHDGANLTSVLRQLDEHNPDRKRRIEEYLSAVVAGVHGVNVKVIGHMEALEFWQDVAGANDPWPFMSTNMSDGTLRALGVLVALFQAHNSSAAPVRLVGIEEPEVALHPAAAGALLDALREASLSTQVIVTTHSPDLVDTVDPESLLAVNSAHGSTQIAPVDEAGRDAVLRGLYTPGDLLRNDQLRPDLRLFGESARQGRLFEGTQ